jgi:type IV secretory pathway VirB2 component (pilin)
MGGIMEKMFGTLGNVIGGIGIAICALAGTSRLFGAYHLLGFEMQTLFIGGIALMVMACLLKLHQLSVDAG